MIDHVSAISHLGVRMLTPLPAGIRNRRISSIYCSFHEIRPFTLNNCIAFDATLLSPCFGNHLFANYLVIKHPLSNIVILLHSKSRKKCHKIFENRLINKNLMPENDLDLVFYM